MRALVLVLPILVMALIWVIDLPTSLGAHPWWSGKTVLIGTPVGLAIAWGFAHLSAPRARIFVQLIFVLFAVSAAYFGKLEFVSSYGDNAAAGAFWYYGWIAISAATSGLIYTVVELGLPRNAAA